MADTTNVLTQANPLWNNFNLSSYAIPTELRSSYNANQTTSSIYSNGLNYGSTQGSLSSSVFGDYSSMGMNDIFTNSINLCNFTDAFTQQNAPIIAQAKAYKDQMFYQQLNQAQQAAYTNEYYKSMGIQMMPNIAINQLAPMMNSLMSFGNTSTGLSEIDQLAQSIGLATASSDTSTGITSSNVNSSLISTLMSLFGSLGSNSTSLYTQAANYSWDTSSSDSSRTDSSNNDAFWASIEKRAAQSRQNNQLQNLLNSFSSLGLA